MKNLNIREVRQELAHLDDLLNREGELVVTRHGKPIARVLPYASAPRMPSLKEFRAKQPYQAIPSESLIREDRDSRDF
jgi:prevent-host-death family protein